jgi:hypothetical protein
MLGFWRHIAAKLIEVAHKIVKYSEGVCTSSLAIRAHMASS